MGLTGALAVAFGATIAGLAVHRAGARASVWELGLESLSLFLSFSMVIAWGAFRWSAVFAVVPLLVALQGMVLLRPSVEGRALAGMGLLLIGSVFLLRRHGGMHRDE